MISNLLKEVDKNPFLNFSPDVKDLCKPLFERFGLNYFEYSRFYKDNGSIIFSSERDYIRFYLQHSQFESPSGRFAPGKYLWEHYIDKRFLEQISIHHFHYHGITYIRDKENYTEIINFAAPKTNRNAINLFINHDEIFDYFITYFLENVEGFIKRNLSSRIILPSGFAGDKSEIAAKENKIQISGFFDELNNTDGRKKSKLLKIDDGSILLTPREMECLSLLVRGQSSKQVARILNLSPRTVDLYYSVILKKAGANSRMELVSKLNKGTCSFLQDIAKQL